ncbi:hypothetical protein KAW18_12735 [candidate division WOR-3 bacterium]|nr:hypothetical protein [candidate division WOR-3 bacterium]
MISSTGEVMKEIRVEVIEDIRSFSSGVSTERYTDNGFGYLFLDRFEVA